MADIEPRPITREDAFEPRKFWELLAEFSANPGVDHRSMTVPLHAPCYDKLCRYLKHDDTNLVMEGVRILRAEVTSG